MVNNLADFSIFILVVFILSFAVIFIAFGFLIFYFVRKKKAKNKISIEKLNEFSRDKNSFNANNFL